MADTQKKRGKKGGESRPSFEDALGRLEEIVARLETGDIALEEAIALAEEGRKLSQACEKQLTKAEGKIEQLVERMGAAGTEPLEPAPEEPEG
jgi:exodeoxyribonuclease VII small subunit